MRIVMRWWFLLLVLPFVVGSAVFWLLVEPALADNVSIPAVWGQVVGISMPLGIAAFALVTMVRLVISKRA
ncbi:hypothetical protein [Aliiroseovarius sp. 2305UL8-7]|uniref:hypothetical protein n=1 Tax=Aliiroseovarius conchicola TaxID=3121637 RepID=UPI003529AE63